MSTETAAPKPEVELTAGLTALVKKFRGNPEKLRTWNYTAKRANAAGYRTDQGRKFSGWSIRHLCKRAALAVEFTKKGSGWKKGQGNGATETAPKAQHVVRRAPRAAHSDAEALTDLVLDSALDAERKLELIRKLRMRG